MALPTYRDIAATIVIPRCAGRLDSGHTCYAGDHARGFVDGVAVHWADRVPRRPGIKRFLMLAAEYKLRHAMPSVAKWLVLWLKLQYVWVWAEKIGVRFPPRLRAFEREQAQLRAMLVKVPTGTPSRDEAMKWASRR